MTLLAGASPSKITGIGDNILSVLLDLDGSDEKKFTTSVKDVNPSLDRKCNSSQFYDRVKVGSWSLCVKYGVKKKYNFKAEINEIEDGEIVKNKNGKYVIYA